MMRNIVLNANEYGSLWELRFPPNKRYAESWTWQPAWTPRAGECAVTRVNKTTAMALAEYALTNECEGDIDAWPQDLIETLIEGRR